MKQQKYLCLTATFAIGFVTLGSIVVSNHAWSDSVVDSIRIKVPFACTMSGVIDSGNEHSAIIQNGIYQEDIGLTQIKTMCNDKDGFAVYAIGYTDNEYGKNVLTSNALGSSHDIATGLVNSGNTSNWSMKLATDSTATYPIEITNGFDSYSEVPSDYTKVASRNSATDTGSNAIGASFTTTYATYIGSAQPAGKYTGQVRYTLVHPHTAPKPGPKSLDTAITLQDVTYCADTLPEGQVYTLTDNRDEQQYKVARLADGNCWMLDNLALDPTEFFTAESLSPDNTNATSEAIDNYLHGGSTNTGWSDTAIVSITNGFNSYTTPMINTQSKDTLVTSYGLAATNNEAKVGVYYNYCAATVGTYCYASGQGADMPDTITDASQDICPANWHMPTSSNTGEYYTLAHEYGSTATDSTSLQYALSIPLSGYFSNSLAYGQNNYASIWSSTFGDGDGMHDLSVNPISVYPLNRSNRDYGLSIRCLIGP